MIEKSAFGRTGHQSSRVIFGAAALGRMRQERADSLLEILFEHGVNHIDTAAGYGDSELRLAPWMRQHRDRFFLATKTGDRDYEGARDSLNRSLERLEVNAVDLIQLHNLTDEEGWETALGSGGALEAIVEARDQGKVRFIGVTGHGTRVAEMHRRSLERFPFDSVLLPYSFTMMSMPEYAAEVERLFSICRERGVAIQTIKSVARRRWQDDSQPRYSWYEPLKDPAALQRGVRYVLGEPDLFLNSSSDANLLVPILEAAVKAKEKPDGRELEADVEAFSMEPLFVRGVSDQI